MDKFDRVVFDRRPPLGTKESKIYNDTKKIYMLASGYLTENTSDDMVIRKILAEIIDLTIDVGKEVIF